MFQLRQKGHRIPEDLSVCALGDSAISRSNDITAMSQPLEAIARNGLFLLDSLMNQRLSVSETMLLQLQPKLIVRGSTVPHK